MSIANGITAIDVADGADGRFNVTFTAPGSVFTLGVMDRNADLQSAVANAEGEAAMDAGHRFRCYIGSPERTGAW